MRRMVLVLVSFTGLLLVSGRTPAEDKRDGVELDRMWDTMWVIVSQTVDGKVAKQNELENRFVKFNGNHITFLFKDEERSTAAVELHSSKFPKQIDITYELGAAKWATLKGIYKLEGDTLTICFGGYGKGRPAEFASKPGSEATLIVQNRSK